MTTAATVQAILNGDHDRFATLVERYLHAVQAVAYANCRNAADAEDITQESFLTAYQRLNTLRTPEKFEGWVTTIARNRARKLKSNQAKHDALTKLANRAFLPTA